MSEANASLDRIDREILSSQVREFLTCVLEQVPPRWHALSPIVTVQVWYPMRYCGACLLEDCRLRNPTVKNMSTQTPVKRVCILLRLIQMAMLS
jgi:hypothetical protein